MAHDRQTLNHWLRVRLAVLGLVALLGALGLAGCAPTTRGKLYQAGSVSKVAAESAYQAIRTGYLDGKVGETDYQLARQGYLTWAEAQQRYVAAARAETLTPELAQQVHAALRRLLDVAARNGVL